MKKNLYQILGVAKDATMDQIKSAYRKLAKKYHPDVHPGDEECEKKFQEITEAYSILSDENKRKKYDASFSDAQNAQENRQETRERKTQQTGTYDSKVDFENINKTFERFFGFDPKTKDVTNEKKLNPKQKNPLDTTDMFERFMGIKR